MKTERVDSEFGKVLEKATPEMAAGWEARARAATIEARPAARRPWRSAMVAAGLAAVIGLGFVPVRVGEAAGVLERAMAAMEGVRGVYRRYESEEGGKKCVFELWQAPGGLRRGESREDGELVHVSVSGRDMGGHYDPRRKEAFLHDTPPPLKWYEGLPERELYERMWLRREERELLSKPEGEVTTWREKSLWGGARDVVEVETGGALHRYEFDSQSGRLLSEEFFVPEGDSWRIADWTTEVLWDVDLPEDTWTFDPPPGTTVHWSEWWVGRTEGVIAEGENEDWYVRLHAIDMDRDGDLYLTLSRIPKPHRLATSWNGGGPIDIVSAVDNVGTRYNLEDGCSCVRDYWARRLNRGSSRIPAGIAKTVTLMIQPYGADYAAADGEEPGDLVTLESVPLPRPQDSDDLFADREELIQY